MARICPVCGSDNTGGSPKRHKDYTPDRGRLDIDFNRCHTCMAYWDDYHYVREGTHEIKDIHVMDGRVWIDGEAQGAPILCHCCQSDKVMFVRDDGLWRDHQDVHQRRYECSTCKAMWVHMTHNDGHVLASRIWRKGQTQ